MTRNTQRRRINEFAELLPVLEKHGLFSRADEFKLLAGAQLRVPLSNNVDIEEQEAQLKELIMQAKSEVKSFFDMQSQTVKIISITWLSTVCDTDKQVNAHEWAIAAWSKNGVKKHPILVSGGYSNHLKLTERLYCAFEDYPKETVEAVYFSNHLYTVILQQNSSTAQASRLINYLKYEYKKIPKINIQAKINIELLKNYVSTDDSVLDMLTETVRAIDFYMNEHERTKAKINESIKKLAKIIKIDNKFIQKHKNNPGIISTANDYFSLDEDGYFKSEKIKIKTLLDILRQTDVSLGFNLHSLNERKEIYSDIEKKYRRSIAKSQSRPTFTFTLTKNELQALDFISNEINAPLSTALRESIRYATSRCREDKKNTDVKDCISEQRSSPSQRSFKMDINAQKNIDQLRKAIASTKVEPPRALNNSLAVGIAIRLYARSKHHREMTYSGEKIAPTDSQSLTGKRNHPPPKTSTSNAMESPMQLPVSQNETQLQQLVDTPSNFVHQHAPEPIESRDLPYTNHQNPDVEIESTADEDDSHTAPSTPHQVVNRRRGRPEDRSSIVSSGWSSVACSIKKD